MARSFLARAGASISLGVLLSACGSGGDGADAGPAEANQNSSQSSNATVASSSDGVSSSALQSSSSSVQAGFSVTANFVKGPVSNGSCTMYEVSEEGGRGDQVATGMTVDGAVTFEDVAYEGTVVVVCIGGTYTDEATGETRTATRMRTVVDITEADGSTLTITPLTEMAVKAAGNLRRVNNTAVARAFGIEDTDIARTRPTDLNTESASNDREGRYGMVLSMLSQVQEDDSSDLDTLIDELSAELEDGAFAEEDKQRLSDASGRLSESEVAGSLNTDGLTTVVSDIQEIEDNTPPSISFSEAEVTLEYGGSADLTLAISDGRLQGDVSCEAGVSFADDTVSSDLVLGTFECTARAIDRNQNTATTAVTVRVVDSMAPVIDAPDAVEMLLGEGSGPVTITAIDSVEGSVAFNVDCGGSVVYEGAFFAQAAGSFTCTIMAEDAQGNEASADISVSVLAQANTSPVANAGSDLGVPTGSKVLLDASASLDADGDSLTYSWAMTSKPANSNLSSIDNSATALASFVPDVNGNYQFLLTVSDGMTSAEDSVLVSASTGTWLINNGDEFNNNIQAFVNVQAVDQVSVAMNSFWQVSATGVPNYEVALTQSDIDALNNRPKAATDFVGGQTSAQAGDVVAFGDDMGYKITRVGCDLGYWPPGPACPSDQSRQANIPATPTPASEDCATSVNTMGLMLNGTSVYNWSDGVSYNNDGVWNQLAPEFEIYDVDICAGHAQTEGDYHHHMWSPCLADLFGDEGLAHSPIYGYAADGYAIYGPWHAKGELAKPSWQKRDYTDPTRGGCPDGQRSCVMVDQYDATKGTVSTNYPGPDTDATVTSNSGNQFVVASGYYFEDYYYDASLEALGGAYLDKHNGHDHDSLGYHYHTTVEEMDGNLSPIFPYNIGPLFYGNTPGGSVFTCNAPGSMPRP